MSFLPWLLWKRRIQKEQEKFDKVKEEMAKSEAVAEIVKDFPDIGDKLRDLGVKLPPKS
jgi:hypothetical protein